MLTKGEKAEIWLDSFQLDYEKKVQIYKLAPSPYELVKNFEKYRAAIGKIAEEKIAVRMEESFFRCSQNKTAGNGVENTFISFFAS